LRGSCSRWSPPPPTGVGRRRARSLPTLEGIQSKKVKARRCRNLNGGFNRFLRPDWSAAGDGSESLSLIGLNCRDRPLPFLPGVRGNCVSLCVASTAHLANGRKRRAQAEQNIARPHAGRQQRLSPARDNTSRCR
jgi:hypothetical protein